MQQLDIFADSRDRILLNDLATAVAGDATGAAEQAAAALRAEFPEHAQLAAAATLIDALRAEPELWRPDAGSLRARRVQIEQQLTPAAVALLGREAAPAWLAARWRHLATAAHSLDYDAAAPELHAAALWIEAGAWREAATAVQRIVSWRRIPSPLAWMVQSRWQLDGLDATWPLLAEHAWLVPERARALVHGLPDPRLHKLAARFEADFDCEQWNLWPAWLLTENGLLSQPLGLAEATRDGPGERSFRLLQSLLHLERQGRHADLVARRRQLQQLSPALFGAYMATR